MKNDGVISKTRKTPSNVMPMKIETRIAMLLQERKSFKEVAELMGVSKSTVQRIRAKYNIPLLEPHKRNQYTVQYSGADYRSKPRQRTEAEIRMRNAMQGLSNWPSMARRAQ
jgi:DNA-binding IclR family transcriptional regulator